QMAKIKRATPPRNQPSAMENFNPIRGTFTNMLSTQPLRSALCSSCVGGLVAKSLFHNDSATSYSPDGCAFHVAPIIATEATDAATKTQRLLLAASLIVAIRIR